MDLSIVVPCFNEERTLQALHETLRDVLPRLADQFEVILVDDGSSDGTLAAAKQLDAENSFVRYIALSRNFGKESALLAGLTHATGRRVAVMDADLQHPPELLIHMTRLLDSGYDQVVARRTRDGEPAMRSALSRMYYRVVNRMADVHLEDGVGDFRILSRRAVDALLSMPESNRFSKGLFAWIGFDTATVPYPNVVRAEGQSKWNLPQLVNYGIDGVISFNNKPLRAAIYLGALVTLLAFGYAAFVVFHTIVGGVVVPGYTTLLVSIAGFGGVHLLFLGVIGEYLGRIYCESKRRPLFLVKDSSPAKVKSAKKKITPDPRVLTSSENGDRTPAARDQ